MIDFQNSAFWGPQLRHSALASLSFRTMLKEYYLLLKKYINGDETHHRTDVYWEAVTEDAQQLYVRYRCEYVKALALAFLDELDRRGTLEEKAHLKTVSQLENFERGTFMFEMFREFGELNNHVTKGDLSFDALSQKLLTFEAAFDCPYVKKLKEALQNEINAAKKAA